MAYTQNEKSTGLDVLTSLATGDLFIVGDVSDSGRAKAITRANTITDFESVIDLANLQGQIDLTTQVTGQLPAANIDIPDLTSDSTFQTLVNAFVSSGGGGGGTKIAIDTTSSSYGSGTPGTAYTISIPGGTLGTNDAIRFKVLLSSVTVDTGLGFIIKYGGTTLGQVAFSGTNSSDGGIVFGEIIANNATNSQKFIGSCLSVIGSATTVSDTVYDGAATVDSTAAQNLVIEVNPSGTSSVTVQAIIVEGINKGNIRTSTTSLTSGDILALNTTPIEIIPSPGAGKVINLIDVNAKLTFASGAYAANTELDIIYAGESSEVLKNTTLLPSGVSLFDTFVTGAQSKLIENTAVQVKTLSGNPTTGAGTLKIYAVYEIITL